MRFILSLFLAVAACRAGDIRALILTGGNDHDWRSTAPCLKKILLDTGRFDARVNEDPAGLTDAMLAHYDVLIVHYNGVRWGDQAEKAVEKFVKSGKGIVATHSSSYAFSGLEVRGDSVYGVNASVVGKDGRRTNPRFSGIVEPAWPEYAKMIGATWEDAKLRKAHAPRHAYPILFTDREHPIARGLGETFLANDELYHNMNLSPEAKVIATAFDDPANGGTGKNEPAIWTVNYGKGRAVFSALGHDTMAMYEPGFIATFSRGVEWAATGSVAAPAPAPKQSPVRVLVAVGGHPHVPSFYSLFEGRPEFAVQVVPHPLAFATDFRKKYDVLVLYDMLDDLSEVERQHLKEFVESGKGVVPLHHAIIDYSAWPWWHQEVTGGKFFRPVNGERVSIPKNNVEMIAKPVGKHPITAGIGPIHVIDEGYKKMWVSPKVHVLMETDSPDNDRPVAWISPYEKSKVVFIQLGHGENTHLNPGYRELVRNAILWSAGKLR